MAPVYGVCTKECYDELSWLEVLEWPPPFGLFVVAFDAGAPPL